MSLIDRKTDPIAWKKALVEAIKWKEGEGASEKWPTVGIIFKIDPSAVRMVISHKAKRSRNEKGTFNTHRGNNKVLTVV